jgi:hypothetical protein
MREYPIEDRFLRMKRGAMERRRSQEIVPVVDDTPVMALSPTDSVND